MSGDDRNMTNYVSVNKKCILNINVGQQKFFKY